MSEKYLLLSEIFPPKTGGSGRWFWDLYTRMEPGSVTVVTDVLDKPQAFAGDAEIPTCRIPLASRSWGVLSLSGLRFYFSLIRNVLRLVKQHDIQSIHCGRTLPEGVVGLVVKLLTGTPYLCYVHGEDIEMCRSSREFTLLVKAVIKHAGILICNSENSAALLRRWWNADETQIRVLNPGVDASVFSPDGALPENSPPPQEKIILTVSRLQSRKGQDMLIKAMVEIIKRHADARYIVVGSGEQYDYLRGLVQDLQLSDHVKLLGECSDQQIRQWYRRSDLFVLPNRQVGNDVEGFGIVLLEAQACGTAVIAGDSGGTRETMAIGETGLIVDCRSPQGLVETISALFDSPEKLVQMGQQGRQRVLSTFDWPRIIAAARDIFAELRHRPKGQ